MSCLATSFVQAGLLTFVAPFGIVGMTFPFNIAVTIFLVGHPSIVSFFLIDLKNIAQTFFFCHRKRLVDYIASQIWSHQKLTSLQAQKHTNQSLKINQTILLLTINCKKKFHTTIAITIFASDIIMKSLRSLWPNRT